MQWCYGMNYSLISLIVVHWAPRKARCHQASMMVFGFWRHDSSVGLWWWEVPRPLLLISLLLRQHVKLLEQFDLLDCISIQSRAMVDSRNRAWTRLYRPTAIWHHQFESPRVFSALQTETCEVDLHSSLRECGSTSAGKADARQCLGWRIRWRHWRNKVKWCKLLNTKVQNLQIKSRAHLLGVHIMMWPTFENKSTKCRPFYTVGTM